MDSKHTPEEELPPPYSAYAGDYASASSSTQGGSSVSHLQHTLTSLPIRIRMNQEAHSVQQSLDDASLLDLVLPKINAFLSSLGDLPTIPRVSRLTIIPEAAVPPNAILSDMEEMRKLGELCQVARVKTNLNGGEKKSTVTVSDSNQGGNSSQDWSVGREFSDWGRFGDAASAADPSQAEDMLWWRDEDMARRLARHLQATTTPDKHVSLQTPVQATVEERLPAEKVKKRVIHPKVRSMFDHMGIASFATESVQANVEMFLGKDDVTPAGKGKAREKNNSNTSMLVTAKEVAFRIENDFGIMESIRGWAVVVSVYVRT